MKLDDIIEECKKHDKILVTGSGRSGTTIVSRIISEECGHEHIDSSIGIRATGGFDGFKKRCQERGKMVFHGPEYYMFIMMKDYPKNVFIVWVNRDWDDIRASAKRVKWNSKPYEIRLYQLFNEDDKKKTEQMEFPENVYYFWNNYIKPKTENYIEVDYDDFKSHNLFIPKDKRKGFGIRQWQKKQKMIDYWQRQYNTHGENYVANWSGNIDKTTDTWFRFFTDVFGVLDIKPKSILDFGCGLGRFSRRLKDYYNVPTYGCDIIPDAIRECRLNHPDIEFFLYNKGVPKTDMVIFVTTLAYVGDDDEYNNIVEDIKDCKYIAIMEPFITENVVYPRFRLTTEKISKSFPNHKFYWAKPTGEGVGSDYLFGVGVKC